LLESGCVFRVAPVAAQGLAQVPVCCVDQPHVSKVTDLRRK
jgi:hypothetical protein